MSQQQQVHLDVNTLPILECPQCQGTVFTPVLRFRKISPLLTPGNPNGGIVTEQKIRCLNPDCGKLLTANLLQEPAKQS